jgi:hypothetical protein
MIGMPELLEAASPRQGGSSLRFVFPLILGIGAYIVQPQFSTSGYNTRNVVPDLPFGGT